MNKIVELTNLEELKELFESSQLSPILIFKHSNTCPISARAKREVDEYVKDIADNSPAVYQVIVQHARLVSNEIADVLNIEHQSPQIILISKGKVLWHTSHGQITKESIKKAVAEL